MGKLLKVLSKEDILPKYRGTAVEKLLEYHNLRLEFEKYDNA